MKRLLIIVFTLMVLSVSAQTPQEEYEAWKRQAQGSYSQYRQKIIDDYQTFRKKANEEYAEFVKSAWASVGKRPAIKPPEEPKPIQPPVAPEKKPLPEVIPHEEVAPTPTPKPVPDVPIPEPSTTPIENTMQVTYYGTTMNVHTPQGQMLALKNLDGETLSKAWMRFSDGSFDALLADCLKAKKQLGLGDWGYITLLEMVTKKVASKQNEAVLLLQWLLTQSGYHARMAKSGNGVLQIWMPFDVIVFNLPYIELDDTMYFLITENDQNDNELQVMDKAFPGENIPNLRVVGNPKLDYKACGRKTLSSKGYTSFSLKSEVNRNLIDYYNDYPKIAGSWDVYASTSLSEEAKQLLYPKLRDLLENKNELEKAERLLNLVQTAFEYKTDEEQFGDERSLFADESLYYPFCDCEDRSILFSILIHDLLDLDVVLLHFPGHLATAVKFNSIVKGDYLDLDDGRYVICDPTYINAPVGLAMPECKDQKVRVFLLK